jgi:O-antigen/teichoic acid export membrane protein
MKALKDSLINLSSQWIYLFLALGINIAIAHKLGPKGVGVYVLINTFSDFIALIISFGMRRAITYVVSKNEYPRSEVINTGLSLLLGIGTTFVFVSLLCAYQFEDIKIRELSLSQLLPIALTIPFLLLEDGALGILVALQEFSFLAIVQTFNLAIRLVLIISTVSVSNDINILIWIIILSNICSSVTSIYLVSLKTKRPQIQFKSSIVRSILSYGIRSYFYGLTGYLNLRLDQYLIAFFLNTTQVGIYAVAVNVSELTLKIVKATISVVFARVSASNDYIANNKFTNYICRINFVIALIINLLLIPTAPSLISWFYGDTFRSAYMAMILLIPGTLMLSIFMILFSDLSGRGKPETGTFATILGSIITLIGNVSLIQSFGINGAAFTSSIAYTVSAMFTMRIYQRVTGATWIDIFLINKRDIQLLLEKSRQIVLRPKLGMENLNK